jgi:hypothetical protein
MLSSLASLVVVVVLAPALPQATVDRNGLTAEQRETLGTSLDRPETWTVVMESPPQSEKQRASGNYDASKDVTRVECAHVAQDRWLWRVTMAGTPRPEDTVLHLYLDADANPNTGRKGSAQGPSTGTDYMVSVVGGQSNASRYDADGKSIAGPQVTHLVVGNQYLIAADLDLAIDANRARYGLYVLCHTITKAGQKVSMSKSTGKQIVSGIPLQPGAKPQRLRDRQENFQVDATYGDDLLRRVLVAPENLVVPHDRLVCEGFQVDIQTSQRFPHLVLRHADARASALAPKAGRYHVGFMMYDDSNDERVAISIADRVQGIAVARQDNNRTWLYWLKQPYSFQGGERVELRAIGPSGKHGICNLVFLPQPPQPRQIEYRVENTVAAADLGQPGRLTLSWTTTWPAPTRFEYGLDARYGTKVQTADPCLVHRVVLEGLKPQTRYHGRAIGTRRDGQEYAGPDFEFSVAPPSVPPTQAGIQSIPLTVANPHLQQAQSWPISTGIPFPQGVLGSVDHVRLMGPKGEVQVQVRLTARWPDGSVKWLLASFLADSPAGGTALYRLEYGRDVVRTAKSAGIVVAQDLQGIRVDTGAIRYRIDPAGNLVDLQRPNGTRLTTGPCTTLAQDAAGINYRAADKAQLTLEDAGPLRVVIKAVAHLVGPKGQPLLRTETRYEAFCGSAMLRVQHTFEVEAGNPFIELKDLTCHLPLATTAENWQCDLDGDKPLRLDRQSPGVWQRFDREFVRTAAAGDRVAKGRVRGSLIAADGSCAIAVRDFWQNYPKGFRLAGQGVDVQLCPAFQPGIYDPFPFEKEGHHLYYYLLNGHYRLRRGMAKTHEMLLCFEPADRLPGCAALFQRPLLATAPAPWYCGTKAFYDVAPRDPVRFAKYEEAVDKNLKGYLDGRERYHDYGMLNYGDWYPERGANWGNIEYDTQHAFFLEYIRSGNPEAFLLGEAAERHNRDVDTVHGDPDQCGMAYIHQMGHVGGYYTKSVPGTLGIPSAGASVSHAWVEGHFDHYFLTGDRRSYEAGCAVADYFTHKELSRPYDFTSCRVPGWHLIMLAAAQAATNDPYYLNAARIVVERVLEAQDKEPRPLPDYQAQGRQPYQLGTWSRMMVPGHCLCVPRHRGNAGFMVAILLAGLKYHHDVTGDPRVKESIILGARGLLDETYSDEVHGFRYTSCPNMPYKKGTTPLMVEGIARAYLWTKDERFRRVLVDSLPLGASGASYGKSFSMYYRMAPRVLADLDQAGITLK